MKNTVQIDANVLDHYVDARVKKSLGECIDEFIAEGGGFCDIGRYSDVSYSDVSNIQSLSA